APPPPPPGAPAPPPPPPSAPPPPPPASPNVAFGALNDTNAALEAPPPPPPPPELPDPVVAKAEALVAPLPEDAPKPAPELLPQEARKKAPAIGKRPPTRRLRPGDLICGDCGEGNQATRKFCGRCGSSLAEAEVVKTPWWRKLLPRSGAKVRASGARPKKRGRSPASRTIRTTFRVARRMIGIALIVLGIAYGVLPSFRGWVNQHATEAKNGVEGLIFPRYEPVAPISIQSPVQTPDHPATLVSDGFKNTHWAAPVNGAEPVVVLKFDRAVDLGRIIVHSGTPDGFQAQHRPERLHLVFSTGRTADVTLADKPDAQELEIEGGEGAEGVEIHVVATFKAVNGTEVAISEIELFRKS
ncbi:NADase-type glycan-binding domain-containing protein, partial [Amycolatopsis anabasis]|uniref:NADase-type glycan-binding domain-containing protein n=1 Tax=Amycolatopsis anabasis TaxID=1840409 RepID=UPI001C551134